MRFKSGANVTGYESNLCNLSDVELMDIGITRGEVDYVVLNLSIDARGARSTPPMRDQRPSGR
jgi:hypothetical protein